MSEKANKREFVEQKIIETDAGVYAYDMAIVELERILECKQH